MPIDVISIIAGGWSCSTVALDRVPGLVIAVNESAVLAPRVDIALTMDRLFLEHRWALLAKKPTPTWARRSIMANVDKSAPWLAAFENDIHKDGLSDQPGILWGNNSGRCALNLAYHMQPKRILLFGFDMQKGPKGEPYWHPPYGWARPEGGTSQRRYDEWRPAFDRAAIQCREKGIEVLNVSARTALNSFPVIAPQAMGLAA